MTEIRTALVVGGASGIGWAVCRAMADDGYRVIVADRDEDGARRCAEELGEPHSAHTVEVTDEQSVAGLFDDAGQLNRQPTIGMSAYCAAKAGVAMLTEVAALELAPGGIRVNAVSPGLVPTPLTAPGLAIPGVLDGYLENTPLGRAGTPEDIADAVMFICSSRASWLTGEVLDLNGGAHLMRYPNLHAIMRKAFE
jgi:3-oxoacyl-[acyl-carrier protein] reductase